MLRMKCFLCTGVDMMGKSGSGFSGFRFNAENLNTMITETETYLSEEAEPQDGEW